MAGEQVIHAGSAHSIEVVLNSDYSDISGREVKRLQNLVLATFSVNR